VALVHLPFGPLVPVPAQLHTPRRVTADLEKQRAELFLIDLEVIGIDVDRLVAIELELPVDLLALEGFSCATPMNTMASRTSRRRRKPLAMSSFLSLCRN